MDDQRVLVRWGGGKRESVVRADHMRFLDLLEPLDEEPQARVMLARIGNRLYELAGVIPDEADEVHLVDTGDLDGFRVYMRTLSFVFLEAVHQLLPGARTTVEHSISGGLYCVIRNGREPIPLDTRLRDRIKAKMRELVDADLPIQREEMRFPDAERLFRERGRQDKVALFAQRKEGVVAVYRMGNAMDSFFGYMAPSTGFVSIFDVELFDHGLVVLGMDPEQPERVNNFVPTYLLSDTYNEAEDWSERQNIFTVAQLNEVIRKGEIGEVVRMSDALQDYKIMSIAQQIASQKKRIVLIAAPSSSGKTSFAYKLRTSLRVLGLRPVALSMDDYFVDRAHTPFGDDGKPDFESFEAVDLRAFHEDMERLLHGQRIPRRRFNFLEGTGELTAEWMMLGHDDPVIVEGIHGLNPVLTSQIDPEVIYRIALSVISQINLDDHNRIPTTDMRLMRRMARDKQFRGKDVRETIRLWPGVRKGERRNIFPYSERADIMFNSSFVYEIAALRPIIEEELRDITPDEPEYVESSRLLALLSYIDPMTDTSDVVNTSILREFIGGSRLV